LLANLGLRTLNDTKINSSDHNTLFLYTYSRVGSLLGSSSSLLSFLALGDGGLAGGSTGIGLLVTLGADSIPRGTNNSTLVLDGTTRALLLDFFSDTLLVKTTVNGGPSDLTGVQTLEEVRSGLTVNETETLIKRGESH
jgi:hypothetical protein